MWFFPRMSIAEHGILLVPVDNNEFLDPLQVVCAQAMVGFMLYDSFADVYVNGFTIDMVLHHILGGISWGTGLFTGRGGLWMMWIMLAEGSTPFLHIGWLLHKMGNKGLLFKVNGYTLVLTFTLLRAVSPALIFYSMFSHSDKWVGYEAALYLQLVICAAFAMLTDALSPTGFEPATSGS